ncbi:MAG: hypothetical protein WD356_10445 [Pseudomonadales bacterium]
MTIQLARISIIVLFFGLLTGCSWFKKDNPDIGADENSTELLDKTPSDTTWYCYGLPDGSWDCRQNEKTDQVVGSRPNQN